MPSKIWTDDQLRELLKQRATRLAQLIEVQAPPPITSREVGMVVSAARLLLGRQIIDQEINESQSLSDAQEAGICTECRQVSSIPGYSTCEACRQEGERICAEMERKYGVLDDAPRRRHTHSH